MGKKEVDSRDKVRSGEGHSLPSLLKVRGSTVCFLMGSETSPAENTFDALLQSRPN